MKLLSSCPVEQPSTYVHARHVGCIRDKGSEQELILSSASTSFVVYTLDRPEVEWTGHCPEGVLIADFGASSVVCFIELKGSLADPKRTVPGKLGKTEHALEQLRSGVDHFGPAGRSGQPRSHGDEHHDQWSEGEDGLDVMPRKDHGVFAVVVAFRQGARIPPTEQHLFGKSVVIRSIQVAKHYNRTELTVEDFLKKVGVPA